MQNVPLSDESRSIGKPVDWVEELDGPCLTISVKDFKDEHTGVPFMLTGWKPDEEELAALNNGGYLWLAISGQIHPVIKLFVGESS